jgi:threonine synthase
LDLIKQRIGRTVLYKTSKLHEEIGNGELYLKMEGVNPTGRIQDRIAYYLVKEAFQLGYKTITVASLGPLGESLAFISERFNLSCKVVMPENSIDKKKQWYKEENVEIIEFGKTYTDAFLKSKELALKNRWYDANHGYDNASITDSVYSEIAEEIVAKLGSQPEYLVCFLSNGALITGLHWGFRTLWRSGKIDRIPKMIVTCVGTDNPIYQAYSKQSRTVGNTRPLNRYKGISRNTIEYNILEPQSVLNAIYDSGGTIVAVSPDQIKEMMPRVKQAENLKVFFRGAASLSAYERLCQEKFIKDGSRTVTILEEGKNLLTVKQLYPDDFDNIDQLAKICKGYLGKYGDGHEGSVEAIKTAFEGGGFVLGAYINGKMKGLAVVIKMPVKIVMPQYHLVYVGADISAGSRGIGTRLMEEVRNLTDGEFSLHVDIENKKAIKLYEKMGLKRAYFRMIAQK